MRSLASAATAVAVITLIAAGVIGIGRRHDTIGYPFPPESWTRRLVGVGAAAAALALLAWWIVAAT